MELKSKKLFLRTNLAICRRSSVAIFLSSRSSNLADNASSPSVCGILRYKPTTSVVTNIPFQVIYQVRLASLKNRWYPLCTV